MNLKNFLDRLNEAYDNPGVEDGTGPYKDSAMGGKGPKSGRKKGGCPKKENYKTEEEYEKALKKWRKENGIQKSSK